LQTHKLVQHLPPFDVALHLAIAIAIGTLVGLEREWSQKDLGTRTFGITAMAGALSVLAGSAFAYLTFAGFLLVVALAAFSNIRDHKPVATTTSAAVIVTFLLGVLAGQGHHYTPVAAALAMTMLLSLKPALTHFAGGLQVSEVRGAVILGMLAFAIYPAIPDRPIDPWQLVNPRTAWLTVVVIAVLGFVNYLLLKLYAGRGLYYSAVLGGMVNSTAAIAELSRFLVGAEGNEVGVAAVIDLLTVLAMFVRNLVILAIFAKGAVIYAAGPLVAMTLAALAILLWQRRGANLRVAEVQLSSPLSLSKVLKFGGIFLVISILGNLGQRYLGHLGFLFVSAIGGLVSSASTAGAAATLATQGRVTPEVAGIATVLTSMASALSNLPLLHGQVRRWPVTRRLAVMSLTVVAAGLLALVIQARFF
jgi:uncharacterized membrane protein (DUF4010 family)